MKIKVSDYISNFVVENGIKDLFTVTGGGAMHLNDSFGHQKGLKCYYNHHEQACSTAAEGYYRVNSKMAAVCVTTGPGSTNAITGVMSAYLDSIPMFVISGEVKVSNTVPFTGLDLRQFGDQEYDITRLAQYMTKYTYMVKNPNEIKYHLEKAFYLATSGRPGPVWLAIPLNVQSAIIDTDDLISYDYKDKYKNEVTINDLDIIIDKIKKAKRPVVYAGSAIRLSGGLGVFKKLIKKLNVPVVCACNAIDSIETDNELYAGVGGSNGNRAGNFAVQNSDFILSLGCRLSLRQVGFNYETWARCAYVVMVDADQAELDKPSLHVDLKIKSEIKYFMSKLNNYIKEDKLFDKNEWIDQIHIWNKKYPVVIPEFKNPNAEKINIYNFIDLLTRNFKKNTVLVVGNGSPCVASSQCAYAKQGFKYIMNSGSAQMGYGLPAAIGACIANSLKEVVCLTGDGSIQMNIQELQTMVTNKLPIKIFLINNEGYHSIRQTQTNYFNKNFVGIGPESHDLSFPEFKKIAKAYGIKYCSLNNSANLEEDIKKVLHKKAPYICEVFVDKVTFFTPKPSSKKLPDGTMVSAPLEDLAPFLSREELKSNMYIPLIGEEKNE